MGNKIQVIPQDPHPAQETVVITELMTREEAEKRYGPVIVVGNWPWEARDEE